MRGTAATATFLTALAFPTFGKLKAADGSTAACRAGPASGNTLMEQIAKDNGGNLYKRVVENELEE